ncbi:MAG: hypothetical protein LBS75_05435 [Synergistaceae bacterium]|nr:hypothetical protein [Synergistaceae bacterium]
MVRNIRKSGVLTLIAFAVLTAFAAAAPPSGASAYMGRGEWEGAGRVLDDTARELGIQTELVETDGGGVSWLARHLPDISPEFAKFTLYAAAALIVSVLLVSLKGCLWSASRARRLEGARGSISPAGETATRMESAQAEADELARRGEFGPAMHVLLLRSVTELRSCAHVSISDSLTSREILRRITRSPKCREAFADIVRLVEISHFGTHLPDAGEYAECRRDFDALTELARRGEIA